MTVNSLPCGMRTVREATVMQVQQLVEPQRSLQFWAALALRPLEYAAPALGQALGLRRPSGSLDLFRPNHVYVAVA